MRRNYLWSGIFIALLLLLSLYSLYPTVAYYTKSPAELDSLERTSPEKFNNLKKKTIKLGLDLQGGMHLVLEVDKSKLSSDERKNAVDRAIRVIRNRIDQFGVSEVHIQKEGDSRIIVELPGIKNIERAKNIIGKTALLQFKLVAPTEDINYNLKKIDQILKAKILKLLNKSDTITSNSGEGISSDSNEVKEAQAEALFGIKKQDSSLVKDTTKVSKSKLDSLKSIYPDLEHPFTSMLARYGSDIVVPQEYFKTVDNIIKDKEILKQLKGNYEFLWGEEEFDKASGKKYRRLFLVKKKEELTGSVIKKAVATYSSSGFSGNEPIVSLTMNSKGARKFARVTARNIKRRLAIVLDNKVIMAPVIQSKIANGSAQITGLKSIEEAKDLAIVLQAGALPAPVNIVEERTVGATLGEDSIDRAKVTVIVSFILVFLFMIIYYSFGGAVTVVSLIFNILLVLGALALFGFTLTLPGVAGLVLTVGMAVDANVLIFERMREELRLGKTIRTAIESGFEKASITILDANITTFLTGIILFYYGTGPIRGFALTLMIGILATLFVSLVFTKLVFEWFADNKPEIISVGKLAFFKDANYRIMDFRKLAFRISAGLVAIGLLTVFVIGLNYSIDFKGGSLIQLRMYQKDVKENDLRDVLKSLGVNLSTEIKKVELPTSDSTEFIVTIEKSENSESIIKNFHQALIKKYGEDKINILRQEMVGPKIGSELKRGALISIILSLIIIILYISFRFEFWYGIGAIVALIHDVSITLGVFAVTQAEFSLSVIAALLTIVGYSLNDTIVIFDRVRENVKARSFKEPLAVTINRSINETLSRTIITSLTTFFTVAALFFFGPDTLKGFSGALMIGIIVGTYSSIYIASPIYLYFVERRENKKLGVTNSNS